MLAGKLPHSSIHSFWTVGSDQNQGSVSTRGSTGSLNLRRIFWPSLKYCQQYTKLSVFSFRDWLLQDAQSYLYMFSNMKSFSVKPLIRLCFPVRKHVLWSAYWKGFPNVSSHVGCLSPEVSRGLPFPVLRGLSCCLSGLCLVSLHIWRKRNFLCVDTMERPLYSEFLFVSWTKFACCFPLCFWVEHSMAFETWGLPSLAYINQL